MLQLKEGLKLPNACCTKTPCDSRGDMRAPEPRFLLRTGTAITDPSPTRRWCDPCRKYQTQTPKSPSRGSLADQRAARASNFFSLTFFFFSQMEPEDEQHQAPCSHRNHLLQTPQRYFHRVNHPPLPPTFVAVIAVFDKGKILSLILGRPAGSCECESTADSLRRLVPHPRRRRGRQRHWLQHSLWGVFFAL